MNSVERLFVTYPNKLRQISRLGNRQMLSYIAGVNGSNTAIIVSGPSELPPLPSISFGDGEGLAAAFARACTEGVAAIESQTFAQIFRGNSQAVALLHPLTGGWQMR
jgi:hypothetical protein